MFGSPGIFDGLLLVRLIPDQRARTHPIGRVAESPRLDVAQRNGVHGSDRECVLESTLQATVSQAFCPNSWMSQGLCKVQLPVFGMSGLT